MKITISLSDWMKCYITPPRTPLFSKVATSLPSYLGAGRIQRRMGSSPSTPMLISSSTPYVSSEATCSLCFMTGERLWSSVVLVTLATGRIFYNWSLAWMDLGGTLRSSRQDRLFGQCKWKQRVRWKELRIPQLRIYGRYEVGAIYLLHNPKVPSLPRRVLRHQVQPESKVILLRDMQ